MTFVEWLRENYDYDGDGSDFDIQSTYSAYELDELYDEYLED